MNYKVIRKQPNSKMCFVCGLKNKIGLKASFFELDSNELVATFTPCEEHQSYPGRLHGGVASAILDETMGRIILYGTEDMWGVTVELNIKYRRPIPLNEELRVIGRLKCESGQLFEATGEIYLANGECAVTGEGKYLKMPLSKIADFDFTENEWRVVFNAKDPEYFEI